MSGQEHNRQEKVLKYPKEDRQERHLGHDLHTIHKLIDKYFTKSWEEDERELTRTQCSTLHFLYDHRDMQIFQKDIEAVFEITGATATNILKGLERQGIIERIPMEEDARLKRILLTEDGIRYHEKALYNIKRMEQTLVAGMSEEEITIYSDLLKRTAQNLADLVAEQEKNERDK